MEIINAFFLDGCYARYMEFSQLTPRQAWNTTLNDPRYRQAWCKAISMVVGKDREVIFVSGSDVD